MSWSRFNTTLKQLKISRRNIGAYCILMFLTATLEKTRKEKVLKLDHS
jgi:hypothetical protein